MKVKNLWIIIVVSLSLVGGFLRFYQIKEIGMIGDDDFFYWKTARLWFEGEMPLTTHFRPLAYWMFGEAFKIFGMNDWAIKLLNGLLDFANIFLVFFLARRVSKDVEVSLICALIYAWIPYSFLQTGREAIHIVSAFWMLLTLVVFFYSFTPLKIRKIPVFFSGVLLGLTANTHPDLGVLGLPFVLWLVYKASLYSQGESLYVRNREKIALSALFSAGFALPFLVVFSVYGKKEVISSFLATTSRQVGEDSSFILKLGQLVYNFIAFSTSGLFFWALVLMLVGLVFAKKRHKRPMPEFWGFFLLTFSCYSLIYAVFISKHMIYRLYFPMIAIALVSFFVAVKRLRGGLWVQSIIAVVVLASFWEWNPAKHPFWPFNRSVSPYRILSDALDKERRSSGDEKQGKILVLPLVTYASRTPLTYKVYVDGKGVYMSRLLETSIGAAVEHHDIKFIWFSPPGVWTYELLDRGFFQRSRSYWLGLGPGDTYDPSIERERLVRYLESHPHRIVSKDNGLLVELL